MRHALLLLALLPAPLLAVGPPPAVSPTRHGDRLRDAYFLAQAKKLGDDALADVRTREDWEKKRPAMKRQFLDMMGLWPLPKRTDLKVTVTGTLDSKHFTVQKLHYQSFPGLYVTANLFVPKGRKGKLPAVLYVCGHAQVLIDKVPHGNKTAYHHHAMWFAENGYVCLVVDTLQLGELPGIHHGTYRYDMWWWLTLGYTPAGIELWNAMRGIDYLVSRPDVDAKRIGVTGRSGGGATSWWVMAADERVACAVPVAGIADLRAHVSEGYPGRLRDGVVAGHCDCMYMVNTHRWDYTQVMALCAPRPVLLGNSDNDSIFPVPGYRRMSDKVKTLYELLGAKDRFALLETKGEHKDTPPLRLGAFRWMNRWLKGDTTTKVDEPVTDRFTPQQLKVLSRPPADALNEVIHEHFRKPVKVEAPGEKADLAAWWPSKSSELKAALRRRSFGGWPPSPPKLGTRLAADVTKHGVRLRAYDYTSEEGWPLRLWVMQSATTEAPKELIVTAVDEAGWKEWVADLGPDFKDALHGGGNPAPRPYPAWNEARFDQHRKAMAAYGWAYAVIAPRGVGPTRWSELSPFDRRPVSQQIKRRFYLLGLTLEGQQVWDVNRGVSCLAGVKGLEKVPLTLQGKGIMAGIALYAAIFNDKVKALELWHPPASHRTGPTFLNVLTILDMPQAVALACDRAKLTLHVKDETEAKPWGWPAIVQQGMGRKGPVVKIREE